MDKVQGGGREWARLESINEFNSLCIVLLLSTWTLPPHRGRALFGTVCHFLRTTMVMRCIASRAYQLTFKQPLFAARGIKIRGWLPLSSLFGDKAPQVWPPSAIAL